MIQNIKFVKNLIIELKNTNPSGCNVVIKNLHPMILFFQKYLKLS